MRLHLILSSERINARILYHYKLIGNFHSEITIYNLYFTIDNIILIIFNISNLSLYKYTKISFIFFLLFSSLSSSTSSPFSSLSSSPICILPPLLTPLSLVAKPIVMMSAKDRWQTSKLGLVIDDIHFLFFCSQ